MKTFPLGSVFALWFAIGVDPSIDVPKENKVYVPVVAKLKDVSAGTKAVWKIVPTPAWKEESGQQVRFTGPPGTYYLSAVHVDFKAETFGQLEGFTTIVGEGPTPQPPGPTPPGPTPPGPVPPGPTPPDPDVKPGMIELPGFHALIKYDPLKMARPPPETSILLSESPTSVRAYLKSKCPPVEGGLGFRFYPDGIEGVQEPWKTPFDRSLGALPVAVISKNGKGWQGSIDGWTPEKFIAKCKEIEALP